MVFVLRIPNLTQYGCFRLFDPNHLLIISIGLERIGSLNPIASFKQIWFFFLANMVHCAIVKLLLLLPFMTAGRLFFFIFTITVVALIRLNDVVSCHETRAWDWLKRVTAALSGPAFRHTCRVWKITNVQIQWVMTNSRELIYWRTNCCGLPVNKLRTAIINHLRMPRMTNFLLLCSNKIVLKTGSSFSWWTLMASIIRETVNTQSVTGTARWVWSGLVCLKFVPVALTLSSR